MQIRNNSDQPGSIVPHDAPLASAAELSQSERSFMLLEMTHMWDRFTQLQEKNKLITGMVLKLYALLFVFAAAPFTLQHFSSTGISRVWGFGGIWLAITVWFYCDRAFRAYGSFLFEKCFCLNQIAQIRKMMVGDSERYREFSLFRTGPWLKLADDSEKDRVHGPTHISRSQITYTVYYYKIVSLFQPLYLLLFLSLIIFPKDMTDPNVEIGRALFLRTLLGFSFVPFIWLITSMERCLGLLKNAFRARRISRVWPWPIFPDEDKHRFHLFGQTRIVYNLLVILAFTVSLCNLIRFVFQLSNKQPNLAYWWGTLDWYLAAITSFIFGFLLLYHEVDVRHILEKAKEHFPTPNDI